MKNNKEVDNSTSYNLGKFSALGEKDEEIILVPSSHNDPTLKPENNGDLPTGSPGVVLTVAVIYGMAYFSKVFYEGITKIIKTLNKRDDK